MVRGRARPDAFESSTLYLSQVRPSAGAGGWDVRQQLKSGRLGGSLPGLARFTGLIVVNVDHVFRDIAQIPMCVEIA
jgi:hypothetical protein